MQQTALSTNLLLSVLAIVIAVLSAFVSVDLVQRAMASRRLQHLSWFASAIVTVGSGLWATNFVGVLAYELPTVPAFDPKLTVCSGIAALVGATATLLFVRKSPIILPRILAAGVALTATNAVVHCLSLASLRMEGHLTFHPTALVSAIVLGCAATVLALRIIAGSQTFPRRLVASILIGASVVGMHIVDSSGAALMRGQATDETGEVVLSNLSVASSIAGVVFMILFMGLTAATFDRRYAELAANEADKLRKANDFTTNLINSSVDGIAAFDRNLVVTAWNPAMERLTGVASVDAVGFALTAVPALRASVIASAASKTIAGESHAVDTEVDLHGGTVFWSIQAAPVIDGSGLGRGGILFVHDGTERRKLQEAMRQTQRLEAVGHMTGSVAHDFANLLTVVSGSTDLLSRDRDLDRHLPTIRAAVLRGRDLIKQLLAFSRRQNLRSEIIHPGEHIRGALDLIRRASRPDIHLSLSVDEGTWAVMTDPSELEIALLNLTVNAKDAMPDGGFMSISARNVTLEDHASGLSGDFVEFRVADTGSGMDPDVASRVWEPYFTTKEVGKGSGLGLSQVYGFAKQCGGTVSLETVLGSGTAILIWLPRAYAQDAESVAA